MQLKHSKMFTFKTYLNLAQIATNMGLTAASTEKPQKKKGSNDASFLPMKAEGIKKKNSFFAPFPLLFSQQRKKNPQNLTFFGILKSLAQLLFTPLHYSGQFKVGASLFEIAF